MKLFLGLELSSKEVCNAFTHENLLRWFYWCSTWISGTCPQNEATSRLRLCGQAEEAVEDSVSSEETGCRAGGCPCINPPHWPHLTPGPGPAPPHKPGNKRRHNGSRQNLSVLGFSHLKPSIWWFLWYLYISNLLKQYISECSLCCSSHTLSLSQQVTSQ